MQGTEMAVEVPQEDTSVKLTSPGMLASCGVVWRAVEPLSPKLAARAVSPTTEYDDERTLGVG
jgi:hypothetical protein